MEEYVKVQEFIKRKSLDLMKHEGKNHARTGIAISNYEIFEIHGNKFYLISTNVFKTIIERYLAIACQKYPENFGTKNAKDVVKAIYDLEPTFDLDRFIEFLQTEQFSYAVQVINGEVQDKILRIDLYRQINGNEKQGFDFIGGIFHCYKHFSYNDFPLSINREINNLSHPKELLHKITEAFFLGKKNSNDPKILISEIEINQKYNLKIVFYFEENTGVYFVKTAHKIKKSKEKIIPENESPTNYRNYVNILLYLLLIIFFVAVLLLFK